MKAPDRARYYATAVCACARRFPRLCRTSRAGRPRPSRESRFTSGLLAQTSVISLFALCSLVAEIVGRARLHRLSRFVRIAGARHASLITFTAGRQETGRTKSVPHDTQGAKRVVR